MLRSEGAQRRNLAQVFGPPQLQRRIAKLSKGIKLEAGRALRRTYIARYLGTPEQ